VSVHLAHLRELVQRGPVRTADVHPHTGLNQLVAVWVTEKVGSMWCAYAFCALSLISLPAAILTGNVIVIVAWIAQTFFQLVLLPVILVGQAVQQGHADARAEQDHEALRHTTELLAAMSAQLGRLEQVHGVSVTYSTGAGPPPGATT
jgi:hypothetical protein